MTSTTAKAGLAPAEDSGLEYYQALWLLPLLLAILCVYYFLCVHQRTREERERRWAASHPALPDHPYGSNTAFAPPGLTYYDWGQDEWSYTISPSPAVFLVEQSKPPPYEAPPDYESLQIDNDYKEGNRY